MPSWPSTLPQYVDQNGYSEKPPKLFIKTSTDAGIAKRRRRFSSGTRPISFQLYLTFAEMQILDNFFMNDCSGGALLFDWVHPRTQVACQFGWVSEPSYSASGAGFIASFETEIMP